MPSASYSGPYPGFVPGKKLRITYLPSLLIYTDESADTDYYLLNNGTNGTLYYNTNTISAPGLVAMDFASYSYIINQTAIYRTDTTNLFDSASPLPSFSSIKVSGDDPAMYWAEGPMITGNIPDAFRIRVVDNVNGINADGDDTVQTGYVSASIIGVRNTLFRGAF